MNKKDIFSNIIYLLVVVALIEQTIWIGFISENVIAKKEPIQKQNTKLSDNNYMFCLVIIDPNDFSALNAYKQKKQTNCQKKDHFRIYSNDDWLFKALNKNHKDYKYVKLGPDQVFTVTVSKDQATRIKEIINKTNRLKIPSEVLPKKKLESLSIRSPLPPPVNLGTIRLKLSVIP